MSAEMPARIRTYFCEMRGVAEWSPILHGDNPADFPGSLEFVRADIADGLLAEAHFLIDRLKSFEGDLLDDDAAAQYHGHVAPSVARLRAAIARAEAGR